MHRQQRPRLPQRRAVEVGPREPLTPAPRTGGLLTSRARHSPEGEGPPSRGRPFGLVTSAPVREVRQELLRRVPRPGRRTHVARG